MSVLKKVFGILFCISLGMGAAIAQEIKIQGVIAECETDLKLFEYNGFFFEESVASTKKGEGLFEFTLPQMDIPMVYFVGPDSKDLRPVILGSEDMVKISGKCGKMRVAQVANSPINEQFEALKKEIGRLRTATVNLTRQLKTVSKDEEEQEIYQQLADLDTEKLQFLDSLNENHPFLAKTLAINTYLSYQNNKGEYQNEILYFADKYFSQADFNDETYNNLPWLTDAIKSYTQTLTRVGLDENGQKMFIQRLLSRFPVQSKARQLALAGIIQTYQGQKNSNYLYFGEQFINEYKDAAPTVATSIKEVIDREKAFMMGGEAPDFSQNTPEGEELNLKDLRGKVVLVDFWASWCGPCRRENPNVVKLYEKYKDKGFEILGVSLDRDKKRWLQAIEQDNLTWQHVSDLKGWQNAVAKQYGVSSIPYTLLLDKDGKIIGKKLRGSALENKLEEIFSDY